MQRYPRPFDEEGTIKWIEWNIQNDKEYGIGLWAYRNQLLCGVILGCMEQFFNGIMFNVKEFWVKNGMRGSGIGTEIFKEFESVRKKCVIWYFGEKLGIPWQTNNKDYDKTTNEKIEKQKM